MRLAAVLVALTLGASDARACSCKSATPEEVFEIVDVVFVGTALPREPSDLWIAPYERLGATTFEVDTMFKDSYAWREDTPVRISLADREDSCAVSFEPGQRYLVYAWRPEGQLPYTGLCAGNEVVDDTSASLARVRAVAANWTHPDPPPIPGAARDRESELSAATDTEVEATPFPWWSVALNVVLGLALLVTWTRRRARAS